MHNKNVKLHYSEFNRIRKSDAVVGILRSEAEKIADNAGHSTVSNAYFGAKRANVSVRQRQTKEDMENSTLLKAVHFIG